MQAPAFSSARLVGALTTAALLGASAEGGGGPRVEVDAAGDARARLTDAGVDGPHNASCVPDLLSLSFGAWASPTAATNPYAGSYIGGADLVRIDLEIGGLVNPPGPLGLSGMVFDPDRFGPRPLYGFIEFDVDRDRDTGGELAGAARNRYLANVARFASLPDASIAGRVARSGADLDSSIFTPPQFERSGAEWVLAFCGCNDVSLVSESGDGDGHMEPGETFIVTSRFFRRVAAFQQISAVFGGSDDGLYDPPVRVRFQHDVGTDRTTVSIVYALTMQGAAQLSGQPAQAADFQVSNHTSIEEALLDLIEGAEGLNGPVPADVQVLSNGWRNADAGESLDPDRWRAHALIGSAYISPEPSLFVWTDAGFDEYAADFNADGVNSALDLAPFDAFLAASDGGPADADASADGAFSIASPGPDFSLYDVDSDGAVDGADRALCVRAYLPGDLSGDGRVDSTDLAYLLGQWGPCAGACTADFSGDGLVNSIDLAAMLGQWSSP